MVYQGYYFNPVYAVIGDGCPVLCLEKYQVKLEKPAAVGQKSLVMDAEDLRRLNSVFPEEKKLSLKGYGSLDAGKILEEAGFSLLYRDRLVLINILDGTQEIPEAKELWENLQRQEGSLGDHFETYWHEGLQRWAPYRLYLPRAFKKEGKNKLLVGLHGGGGCPDNVFKNSKDKIKDYAERDGYIILAPDGSTVNSTYGCVVPPFGMPGELDDSNPENPGRLSPHDLLWVSMGEIGMTQILTQIRRDYEVDDKEIYMMGNSMGGMGTLYYASRHPEVFRKISPSGAVPDIRFFKYDTLKNTPIFFVAGELDSHGVKWLREGAEAMIRDGLPLTYREVEGGTHPGAWVDVLEEIFAFLKN